MNSPLYVYKAQGFTPLEIVKEIKKRPEYENETISYAGRLDPMAEGVLVLLVGNDNKRRKEFEAERKTYEVDILLGVETDTYDALGLITKRDFQELIDEHVVQKALDSFKGKFYQEYPPYSSMTVKGKPLYYWSRKNKLSEIEIPKREVEIYSISLRAIRMIETYPLLEKVIKEVSQVKGDFRQELIKESWKKNLAGSEFFQVVSVTIESSSGTYMRSLAHNLGKKLSTSAITLHIKRTKVGNIGLEECIYL